MNILNISKKELIMDPIIRFDIVQGSEEWLKIRKEKIGASDSAAIMGVSPWTTRENLLEEKTSDALFSYENEYMKRGKDLEELARELFNIKTGILMTPCVVFSQEYPWMMASLDGISTCRKYALEIKCPGKRDHSSAVMGNIPYKYTPQVQHQSVCVNLEMIFYFSFDGFDGTILEVKKDKIYCQNLIFETKKFYDEMMMRKALAFN